MKKNVLKIIRKINIGKKFKRKKFKKISKMLYYRIEGFLKFKKIFLNKYNTLFRFFRFFRFLIFKKEFFFFNKFILLTHFNKLFNFLFIPTFIFEKQFLFKFIDYRNLMCDNLNYKIIFLKKNYLNNTNSLIGSNYFISLDNNLQNPDLKNPVFYWNGDFNFFKKTNFLGDDLIIQLLNLNKIIFFYLIVDIYKFLILIQMVKLVSK